MTQEELAVKAGVAASTIGNVETGSFEGRPYSLRKIAKALGVEVADLEGDQIDQVGGGHGGDPLAHLSNRELIEQVEARLAELKARQQAGEPAQEEQDRDAG
jgi:transcriptional regulator with XRE-family HTH domain